MTGGVGGVDCRDAPVGAPPEGNAKEVTWPPCPHCICSASMWSLPRVLKGRFAKLCVPEHSNIVIEAILTPHSWSTTQLSSATKEVCAVACENGLNMYRTARMSLMSGARRRDRAAGCVVVTVHVISIDSSFQSQRRCGEDAAKNGVRSEFRDFFLLQICLIV